VKVGADGILALNGDLPGNSPSAAGSQPPVEEGPGLTVTDAAGMTQRLGVSGPGGARAAGDAALPPPPPAGAFDVRFAGDRGAVAFGAATADPVAIAINGARYPVTISWTEGIVGVVLNAGPAQASLDVPGSIVLRAGCPVEIAAAPSHRDGPPTPSRFGLAGNYPNPFNPSTAVRFELPAAADVRLPVYNAIGEQVALLADGTYSAGTHTVVFDASGLPGGVYYCRLVSADGISSIRMLLVK
jgi:hypothetical protein